MKPRLVLLDADVVIHLHEIGRWVRVVEACDIIIPETVANIEAEFFMDSEDRFERINLLDECDRGLFLIEGVDVSTIQALKDRLGPRFEFEYQIHSGELEAIALLEAHGSDGASMCTGDFAATIAACCLGHSDEMVSLEAILDRCGLTTRVQHNFSESELRRKLARGRELRIQFYV